MRTIIEPSFHANIWIAGDLNDCRRLCKKFCAQGLCVTVTQTEFIYTGGAETGMLVRLLNYPRFPATAESILTRAKDLAIELMAGLYQTSALVEMPAETFWLTTRETGTACAMGKVE